MFWFFDYLVFVPLDINNILFNVLNRLDVLLSEDLFSRNRNWDFLNDFFSIDDWFSNLLFGIDWSLNLFSSNDRGLNNSLSDNWLRNDFLIDDRLVDNSFDHFRLGNNLLGLLDGRVGE